MRWFGRTAALTLALALALALAACGEDGATEPAGGPRLELVVGDLVPLSGDRGAGGRAGRKAANLAIEQIEAAVAKVGVDHTLKLIHANEGTTARAAVRAGRRAVSRGSSCIAGPWSPAASVSLARALGSEGPLQISPVPSSGELAELDDDGLVNSTALPDSVGGAPLADAIARSLGGAESRAVRLGVRARPARGSVPGAGASSLAEDFSQRWRDQGGEIVEQVLYSPGRRTYDSAAGGMVAGSADATVILDSGRSFTKFLAALARTGEWNPAASWGIQGLDPTMLTAALRDPSTIDGFRVIAPVATGPRAAVLGFDLLLASSGRTDATSSAFAAQSFDAVILCYLSAVAAGSTDGKEMAATLADLSGPGGKKYTWRRLPEAIEALLNGEDIDYVGASGPVDLDEHGNPSSGAFDIVRFKAGAMRRVGRVAWPEPG